MNKLFLFALTLTLVCSNLAAQQPTVREMDSLLEKGTTKLTTTIKNQTKELKDSLPKLIAPVVKPTQASGSGVSGVITFLPPILFLLILFIVLRSLKKADIRLADFLVDKETQLAIRHEHTRMVEANAKASIAAANAIQANAAAYAAANVVPPIIPPATPAPVPAATPVPEEQSTSRLIAFICGLTSVAIAVCITTFYFYKSFSGESNVSIGNLANVLYGLGLGVLPYGFNKVAGALKS